MFSGGREWRRWGVEGVLTHSGQLYPLRQDLGLVLLLFGKGKIQISDKVLFSGGRE
jgi:hypothetical protein